MTSFFDLQKYAATGIASADMTAFDKMRALAAFGGGTVQTLTGIPPLSFKADGTPLISWSMLGNGSQSGSPTPDNPVMPEFVGARTGNLFNVSLTQGVWAGNAGEPPYVSPSTKRICTSNIINLDSTKTYTVAPRQPDMYIVVKILDSNGNIVSDSGWKSNVTFSNAYGIVATFRFADESEISPQDFMGAMLNEGSTALPYEPFGYKIPISCGGQTTPVYLGQTQTVRRIRKLVLTGEENITSGHLEVNLFNVPVSNYLREYIKSVVSTHYTSQTNVGIWSAVEDKMTCFYAGTGTSMVLYIRDSTYSTVADFKSYLAAQYAAGTPVKIWYVRATEQTAIINEPLAKIGDYADELHSTDSGVSIPTVKGNNVLTVETDLQPSEMTITYRG